MIHPDGPKCGAVGGDFTCCQPELQPAMTFWRHQGDYLIYSPSYYLLMVMGEESQPKIHLFSWPCRELLALKMMKPGRGLWLWVTRGCHQAAEMETQPDPLPQTLVSHLPGGLG